MKAQGYYRDITTRIECNETNHEKPLAVNCTGYLFADRPFVTHIAKGRRDYYLQYITEGELTAETNDGRQPFRKGDFIVWEADKTYHYELAQGKKVRYLWLHFTGLNAGRAISDLGLVTNKIYTTEQNKENTKALFDVFGRLFSEFADRRPFFDEACAFLLSEILVTLTRISHKTAADKRRELVTVSYLHLNFGKDTRIDELAKMEHLSLSRYRELFRKQTGMSPIEYRTAVRISHACRMLTETDFTVAEIAADCGYPDVFYFMRVFKERMGVTPGEYRHERIGE